MAFNQPLSLDTSSLTSMHSMFKQTEAFNQPLHFSDTSRVEIMKEMFKVLGTSPLHTLLGPPPPHLPSPDPDTRPASYGHRSTRQQASAFNQPLSLDTSSVTTMEGMFAVCSPSLLHTAWATTHPISYLPTRISPRFVWPPFDSAASVSVQPAAKSGHV